MPHPSFKILFGFVIVLSLFLTGVTKAQNSTGIDSLLSKADTYYDEGNEDKSLEIYLQILNKDPDNYEALWHSSMLYARIGFRQDSRSEKEDHYVKSLEYAEKTLELYPDKGYAHFVYAMAQGRMSDISDASTRIDKSYIIKEHTDSATKLLPEYAPAWHLLGTWHSKVANVGTAQKLAAGVFSKGLPEGASNQKAVEYIQKAIELDPTEAIRFKLDLARHYIRAGNDEKAISTLEEVIKMKANNPLDTWNLDRARELLNELS